MNDGSLHEISEHLGRLAGTYDGLKDLIAANHSEADKHWSWIEAELRTIKHDQRNLEQQNISQFEALRRMGDKLRPLEALPDRFGEVDKRIVAVETTAKQIGGLNERLSLVEKIVYRAMGMATLIVGLGSFIVYLVTHFGGEFLRWLIGRP
jgi:hypothetical protein